MATVAPAPNGRIKLTWAQVVAFVGWLAMALLAYGAVDSRVRVLEDRYDRLLLDVTEIKDDVKTLLQRESNQ